MATVSITSNDGKINSESAVLEVSATNEQYNQPVLRIKQAGTCGGAASIRINDPKNPNIEFVETCLTGPDPGAGKFEIAVQSDKFRINGHNANVGPNKGFDTLSCSRGRQRVAISVSDSLRPKTTKSLEEEKASS